MRHLILVTLLLLAACNDKLPRDYLPDAAPGSCGGGLPACASDEYCDYALRDCGQFSFGTCKPKPTSCTTAGPLTPVCTCGGGVEPSECDALKDGKLLSHSLACDVPTSLVRCGAELCDPARQYCEVTPVGNDFTYATARCVDVSARCPDGITCECLAAEPCSYDCVPDAHDTGTTLYCTKDVKP